MTDSVRNTDELDPREELADPVEDIDEDDGGVTAASSGSAPEPGAAPPQEDPSDGEGEGDSDGLLDLAEGVEGSLDAELVALREEFEKLNDRHLRLAAEFNNYRRRVEQERLDQWGRAQADMVGKLVDVLDDLQRVAGLDLSNATVEAIMEGIDLVERKFMRVLNDAGVEVVDPEGEPFDPETMEAMLSVPAESDEDDEKVAQVFQKGYALKGILIRPARVSVHKND
ncbi:MAG: nucleotide exchange factor GrpE [Gemmatimonadota bacterium]|jgi:molecular chaperone GrpE